MNIKKKKIGDIATIIDGDRGNNYPKQNEFSPSGYCLFLNAGNVTANGFVFDDNSYITQEKDALLRKGRLSRGDIVYTTRGTIGNVAYYSNTIPYEHLRINSGMVILRVNVVEANAAFLYQYLKSAKVREYFLSFKTGSAQPQLPIKNFSAIEIDLPDLPTQRRIASILSAYDDLIENNRRQIKLLEEAAQRLYREWFVELRFPGHEGVKVVDGVPEGWMKGTVDNIVKLLSGYPFKSSEYVSSGKYRLITIKNVKDGEFSPDNVDYIDQLPDKVPSHCILTEGDILLSLTGNIGRVCIVNGYNYLLNQRVAKLQTLHPAYAYCMFRSKEMLNKMTALSNGVAQQNLSPIRAEKIRILIPSSNLLSQFKNIVEPIISQIILLNNQITFACEARDRLLPELMDGEMEV